MARCARCCGFLGRQRAHMKDAALLHRHDGRRRYDRTAHVIALSSCRCPRPPLLLLNACSPSRAALPSGRVPVFERQQLNWSTLHTQFQHRQHRTKFGADAPSKARPRYWPDGRVGVKSRPRLETFRILSLPASQLCSGCDPTGSWWSQSARIDGGSAHLNVWKTEQCNRTELDEAASLAFRPTGLRSAW